MPVLIKKKCSSDGKLTRTDLKDIAEAKEDVKAGRVHTPEQVRKNLGI
jgi:thymidine phosphorylase